MITHNKNKKNQISINKFKGKYRRFPQIIEFYKKILLQN